MQFGFSDANPEYNIDSAALRKWRSRSRQAGIKALTRDEIVAYADAVEKAVLAKQRSFLRGHSKPERRVNCASGTNYTTGEAIHEAVRAQLAAKLNACPSVIRRKRTDWQWRSLYDDAMKRKRERVQAIAA